MPRTKLLPGWASLGMGSPMYGRDVRGDTRGLGARAWLTAGGGWAWWLTPASSPRDDARYADSMEAALEAADQALDQAMRGPNVPR